ncbi:MAG TPA: NAD(P)-dependent oxidoreductase [Marmoricola sp.]
MRVAVIGTGIMGAGIAGSLAREGHEVVVWNRTAARAEAVAGDGVTVAASVAEAVSGSDALVTVLFDTDAVLAVTGEIVGALGPDAVWIQTSTVGPDGARRIAEAAGGQIVDAPVLGTKKPAQDGTLVVLASGPSGLLEKARPVFDAIGSRTVVAGDVVGQASALKLATNSWVGLITAGAAQSLALGQALGLDPGLVLEAIKGGPADSPYLQLKGAAMIEGSWTTSFAVDGVVKDLGLMIDAAEGADFPSDLLRSVRGLFEAASAGGHGADDMAAVRTAFPHSP